MINIDKWVAGYKVRAFDWVDGKNIYLHIEYYKPGASLAQPPAVEKSFLIPREEEGKRASAPPTALFADAVTSR